MSSPNALLVDVLQEATCISQAYSGSFVDASPLNSDPEHSDTTVQLLVNAHDKFHVYNVDTDGALILHHTVHILDRAEQIVLLPASDLQPEGGLLQSRSDLTAHPSTHLLSFSSDAVVSLLELQRDGTCTLLASASILPDPNPATGPIPRRMQGVCHSPPHMLSCPLPKPPPSMQAGAAAQISQSSTSWLVASAIFHDHIHIITVCVGQATLPGELPSAQISVTGVWLKTTQMYGTVVGE